MKEYIHRNIDKELIAWKDDPMRKPLLLRGARQVGKSSAVRHFGKRFQHFAENLSQQLIELIMAGSPQELVNRGGLTEMVAGLELMRNKPCIQRQKMFFWEKTGNSIAEIDYLEIHKLKITPIEIKSGTQGGMKSLWLFMREKHLTEAFRCSLENFGEFEYVDKEDDNAIRHIHVLPLYALSQLDE